MSPHGREARKAAHQCVVSGRVDPGRRSLTVRSIVKENLPSRRGDKILKFGGPRAVLAPATRGWTYKGYVAGALRSEVGLTADQNAFHNVRAAVEDWRSRIASVSVQIGHEERAWLVVPNCRPSCKLGW